LVKGLCESVRKEELLTGSRVLRWFTVLFVLMASVHIASNANGADLKISLLSPIGGETWVIGSTCSIKWEVTQGDGAEKIEVRLYGDSKSVMTAAGLSASEGVLQFEVPLEYVVSDNYYVEIDNFYGTTLAKGDVFSIIAKPTLKVRAPAGGEKWVAGGVYSIAWESLEVSGRIKIELLKNCEIVQAISSVPVGKVRTKFKVPSSLSASSGYAIRFTSLSNPDVSVTSKSLSITRAAPAKKKWTILAYLDADNDLQAGTLRSFNRMARVGSNAKMNVLAQFDRIPLIPRSYGGWFDSKRFMIRKNMTPTAANAIQDLGELNMASRETLINYINWAVENYPAERYFLILSDHGYTWEGNVSQSSGNLSSGQDRALVYDQTSGVKMSPRELDKALRTASAHMDIVGMDACEEAFIENAYAIKNSGAKLMIAPQTIIGSPVDGLAYNRFLAALSKNPSASLTTIGKMVCDTYIACCKAVKGNGTMSAVYLPKISSLVQSLSKLAHLMETSPKSLIMIKRQAQGVDSLLAKTIVAEGHTSGYTGKYYGLNIYFPTTGPLDMYSSAALQFVADTEWRDFLAAYPDGVAETWIGEVRRLAFKTDTNIDLRGFIKGLIDH